MTVVTSLYRHYDAGGSLLYVGISLSAMQRLAQHKDRSHWFDKIASVAIEQFPCRADAISAERRAIVDERPAFNIVHKPSNDNLPDAAALAVPVAPSSGFVGLFGHTHDDDGGINWQFEIVREGGSGLYLAQLFSWVDGRPTNIVPMTAAEIVEKGHSLYATRDEWIYAHQQSARRHRARRLASAS